MAEPFLAEIRLMSFVFPPKGWALCNGQLLPINQNQTLFSLLGTTFGGNGQTTFGLPNLQGRTPIHVGSGHTLGEQGGEQSHTLSIAELPTHTHIVVASSSVSNASPPSPTAHILADSSPALAYNSPSSLVSMSTATLTNVGGSQAHLNLQPF